MIALVTTGTSLLQKLLRHDWQPCPANVLKQRAENATQNKLFVLAKALYSTTSAQTKRLLLYHSFRLSYDRVVLVNLPLRSVMLLVY